MSLTDFIKHHLGETFPLVGGHGTRLEPTLFNVSDKHLFAKCQMLLLDTLLKPTGFYWRCVNKSLVTSDGKPLEKIDIEVIELTETEKVTENRGYYFDISNIDLNGQISPSYCEVAPDPSVKMLFEIGFLHFKGFTNYELDQPGLGFAVAYSAPKIEATIYVYDQNRESVPEDLTDPIVVNEFENSAKGISIQHPGAEAWEDPPYTGTNLSRYFRMDPDGNKVSAIIFTTSSDRFIKLRITWMRDSFLDGVVQNFIQTVLSLLGRTNKNAH